MRILHLSDTHLGHLRPARGAPDGWTRGQDHHAAVLASLDLAGDVDLIVHTGDLFDRSRPPGPVIHATAALLTAMARRCPVVVLPGNHDRRGLLRTVPLTIPGLHVVDQAERLCVAGLALAVVPFLADAEGWSHAAGRAVGSGVDLLLCHQAVDGCRVPGFRFSVGRQRDTLGPQHVPAGVSHILCGHIHPRQALMLGDAQVVMPGSTERTSFSEHEQVKGVALWDLGRQVSWRWLDLPSRPMAVVRQVVDLDGLRPGTLVRVRAHEPDQTGQLERACVAAGAWVTSPQDGRRLPWRRAPASQRSLFSA